MGVANHFLCDTVGILEAHSDNGGEPVPPGLHDATRRATA
jgi:hypothetical protein